jgi:hypothetical protein
MPKRRSTAKPTDSPTPTPDPARPARPPLPSTSRSYGKVTGGKSGKPPVPKTFSHRKRG